MSPCRTVSVCVVVLVLGWPASAAARAQEHRHQSEALVDVVSRAIQPFASPAAAVAAGYAPFLGCVSGPQEGAS